MIQIDKELSTAKKASLQSAKLLINQKKLVNDVISNEGRDIKLRADIESENIIKKYLKDNSDLPILAEESGANEDLGSSFWVVDPLDGTSNYSRDFPICCISIALIHENKIILGVINDFNRNIIFEGSTETPAMMNSKLISVSDISDKTKATLATGLPAKGSYKDEPMLALAIAIFTMDGYSTESIDLARNALKANPKYSSMKYQANQLWGANLQKASTIFFDTKEMITIVKEAKKQSQ